MLAVVLVNLVDSCCDVPECDPVLVASAVCADIHAMHAAVYVLNWRLGHEHAGSATLCSCRF